MINQAQIMMQETKLSVPQKYTNIIFVINDTYILVRVDITIVVRDNGAETAFSGYEYAPFIKCTTKIDGTTLDDG